MKNTPAKMALPGFATYAPAWCDGLDATEQPTDERTPSLSEWNDLWARRADHVALGKGH